MTDKQIIIDGIDVSGCEWIKEVGLDSEYICTCNSHNKTHGYCKYNTNCCTKELQRKKQECEELNNKYNKLKQALIEIKEIVEQGVMFEQILQKINEETK